MRGVEEHPCDVPTWAIEATDHTCFHGIGLQVERHDGHRARVGLIARFMQKAGRLSGEALLGLGHAHYPVHVSATQFVSLEPHRQDVQDMRLLAKQRLPGPIFHYIDGAADDELTYRRNTQAFEECDLIPNVLAGVENIDMSVTVMGSKIDMPIFCSPPRCSGCFTMTVNAPLLEQPKNSAPCSAFPLSAL